MRVQMVVLLIGVVLVLHSWRAVGRGSREEVRGGLGEGRGVCARAEKLEGSRREDGGERKKGCRARSVRSSSGAEQKTQIGGERGGQCVMRTTCGCRVQG